MWCLISGSNSRIGDFVECQSGVGELLALRHECVAGVGCGRAALQKNNRTGSSMAQLSNITPYTHRVSLRLILRRHCQCGGCGQGESGGEGEGEGGAMSQGGKESLFQYRDGEGECVSVSESESEGVCVFIAA